MVIAATGSPSLAGTLNVPADYPTIFQAIQFAGNGDTILVSPGVYPEQVDFQGKDIVIRSTSGPDVTFLDGQGQYTVVKFVSGEGPTARLEGFTVRNGLAVPPSEAGGIWCKGSDPTIVDCIVTDNQGVISAQPTSGAPGSGGIGMDGASATIEGCVIESNVGGAFSGVAGAGGIGIWRAGLFGNGNGAVIRNCLIRLNRGGGVIDNAEGGPGALFTHQAIVTIEDCTVADNVGGDLLPVSTSGKAGVGGIWAFRSSTQIRRCRVLSNQGGSDQNGDGSSDGGAGGIHLDSGLPSTPSPHSIVNTIVAWNRGGDGDNDGGTGGMLLSSEAWADVTNCAIVGNVGGADDSVGGMDSVSLRADRLPTVSNTLLWMNEGQGARPHNFGTRWGPSPVTSNLLINVDPEFVDLASDDFHLKCTSPAIDAGTDIAPALPPTDVDGEPRLSGTQVDIGPDEVQNPGAFPTYCQVNPNSSGNAALISALGCLSIARNEMRVHVDGLPGTPGLLFYGPNQIQTSFGDGFRCVGGAVRRMAPMPGMGPSISIDLDLSTLQITPGVQSNFQYWFRDPMAGGAGFNLSDGLEANFAP